MPPFRPANLNKRAYPGNASVIGPTCTATVGFTTTTCCSSTASCAACCSQPLCLGCRCSFCGCPFCNVCCCCPETVCDRTIPSGRWKASEQYEAATRRAWGDDSCSCGAPSCLCCTNVGFACTSNITDCQGFFICCGPSTNKWFVAPACTQVSRTWFCKDDVVTVANSCMGSCGWFVPSDCQALNPGYCCRTYWDSFCTANYWTSTDGNYSNHSKPINMSNGGFVLSVGYGGPGSQKTSVCCVRAFRCTAS